MYSKILVAIDGSKQSLSSIKAALDIGRCFKAEVHAIYAIDPGVLGATIVDPTIGVSDPGSERIFKMLQEEGKKIIEDTKTFTDELDYDVEFHLKIGDARDVIIDLANDLGAELVVIGSTGKGMAKRIVLGSVSSSVVLHSKVSTLVVRDYKN